ncbi:TonB-dependent receptor plug domain-containing protein [Kluyvera ascorbata]|uniref:TonB-dependent receptor plug domain-containing protein n=1 Tax=Kluyvera ascorbata TaxID=51288 RepID=UPI0004E36DB7|nr:TonB-dependent receptor plug domain-containing protein [Kluyvera ascorbata]EJG2384421.1 TonB-dependent receptor [Kluyvera ascorbata]KFD07080.1 putative TonB-dependent hemin receptor [Kluyvera ascorbata ATCC 33433]MDU1196448.1 TonB-dependent receptor plug domain-containing protein [Kluyvera ascorbata]MDZ4030653.1 TonB-dependent receptor plug domain-containing protein [Kluyvera ascorbata]STW98128.1 TonB-dependent Receptor Plug Domain [Kluyvera ascorbata]
MNKTMCFMVPLMLFSATSIADEDYKSVDKDTAAAEDAQDDTIIVRSTPTSQTMGTQTLNANQIADRPTANGSVTELLKYNPNVRFSNQTDSSLNPGEISPENVSFHGEKYYNNNFMIDGLSNNSTINPGANGGNLTANPDGYAPTDLPAGGTQAFWVTSDLLDSVDVYDSNVSAKYGNFTGGVVDARLKDPSLDRASGKISWRSTRSAWTSYHISETDKEDFNQATKFYNQPNFTKNFYTATFNQPINDSAGFIFSYSRQQSTIPQFHTNMNQWTDQKRVAENYLLKGTWFAENGDIFRLTGMYSPHELTYYKSDVKDGGFTNSGGGWRANIEWEHMADWGKITSLAGYQYEQNKIEQESSNYRTWYRYYLSKNFVSDAINWGSGAPGANAQTANIGGYGNYGTDKTTTTLKQDAELNPFSLFGMSHQIDAGWEMDMYQARYRRFGDVYANRGAATISSSTVCQSGDDFCIGGEQYFKSRTLYPERSVQGSYNDYAFYLQDSVNIQRLELTPGVRVQYDDFLKNTTVAPRFAASLDVFGDKRTRLFGGANRYYGQNLLAYKLRNGIGTYYIQTRADALSPWVTGEQKSASIDYDISDLKTPYSDEVSLGLSQRVLDTVWTVKWVNRKGRDQFGRESTTDANGDRYYILSNNAKTEGTTWSLSAEPISPYHFSVADLSWSLGASIVNNKSSSQTWYDASDTDDTMVIFNNKLMEKADMDALDFNSPWNAFVNINTWLPALNLNWNQSLRYTAGYEGYTTETVTCPNSGLPCGNYTGSATRYNKTQYKDYFTWDWRFAWRQPTFEHQSVELTLDVLNVLDNVIEATQTGNKTSKTLTYKTGRQFWLGVAYSW